MFDVSCGEFVTVHRAANKIAWQLVPYRFSCYISRAKIKIFHHQVTKNTKSHQGNQNSKCFRLSW
jgi:hypothetical protein